MTPRKVAIDDASSTDAGSQGVSSPEVRRFLLEMRKAWHSNSPSAPMEFSRPILPDGPTIEEFALRFLQAQHTKRHHKPRPKGARAASKPSPAAPKPPPATKTATKAKAPAKAPAKA